jgi:hypothetical protein
VFGTCPNDFHLTWREQAYTDPKILSVDLALNVGWLTS